MIKTDREQYQRDIEAFGWYVSDFWDETLDRLSDSELQHLAHLVDLASSYLEGALKDKKA